MSAPRTPWHVWVVGVFAVLWNGFGCFDYVMTQTNRDQWFAQMGMTEAQLVYFNAMPAWTHAAWAVGVWGGLAGGLAGAVYAFGMSDGMEAMGPMWPMQIVIGGACVFFVWYAWMLGKKGVLR